ncbi:MAG: PH domain-containing protein [Pyrinomonadaceae bacterium]
MFCIKCGTNNLAEAVYCNKCGNQFVEEETRAATRNWSEPSAPDAAPIFSITPTLLFVKLGYVLAVIAAFLLVAILSVLLPSVSSVVAIGFGLLLLLLPAFYHFKQKLIRYTLTDTTVEIDKGIVARTTQNVPLRRIQDVTVSSTLIQRVFRFGDILIDNASEDGGKVVLKNIDAPRKYADILLKQMGQLER